MRKFLLLIACVAMLGTAMAQDSTGIHYNNTKIGYSRIISKKVGNIAGAYLTFGLSSANSSKVIEGSSSGISIKETQPEFTITFGEDKITGYIFSNERNIDNLLLVQLHKKKGKRELITGKYGLAGVQMGVDEKDVMPLGIERIGENKIKVHPKKPLKKGEYCFHYIGVAPSEESVFNGVFDFSIE